MLVIKAPHMSMDNYAELLQSLQLQAKYGVVLLPPGLELLNEVPADEEIKVVQQITAAGMVTVPAEAWAAAVSYITALHDCGTCKHAPKCTDPDCFFAECTVAGCACRTCRNGSAWEWRHGHGK